MIVECKPCPICGESSTFEVDFATSERILAWVLAEDRPHVQDALPELTADQREQLLTGCHGSCYDAAFGEDE